MLSLWPVRFYRPVRLAISATYGSLADYLSALGEAVAQASTAQGWGALAHRHRLRVRQAMEKRGYPARSRRGRSSESRRGALLLLLLERADQLFALCATLNDVLDVSDCGPVDVPLREELTRLLTAAAGTVRLVATRVETEETEPRVAMDWRLDALSPAFATWSHSAETAAQAAARAATVTLAEQAIGHMRKTLERVSREIDGLDTDGPARRAALEPEPRRPSWRERVIAPLTDNLSRNSVVLRHALRVGTVAAASVVLATLLKLHYGYWITIAVVIVLHRTRRRRRSKGSSGWRAPSRAARWPHSWRPRFVSRAALSRDLPAGRDERSADALQLCAVLGVDDRHVRAADRAARGKLAARRVADSQQSARQRPGAHGCPAPLAQSGADPGSPRNRGRAEGSRRIPAGGSGRRGFRDAAARQRIVDARRRLGLAFVNADASLQRLVAESPGREADLEPCLALLVHTRRLSSSVATLTELPPQSLSEEDRLLLTGSTEALEARLQAIETGMQGGAPPGEHAGEALRWPDGSVLLKSQLERIERRLADVEGGARRLLKALGG